jgi:2'-hydroxyisoflavone reductase
VTGETYGPLKALCENEVRSMFEDRAFIVRPGLLVGPCDPTGRFTYWVRRIASGGEVLAPGDPDAEVQFIDTRDAADWLVRCAEARIAGVQNMTGPRRRLSMRGFLDACRETLNPDARLVWLSEPFLLEHGVTPWTEVPLWIPSSEQGVAVSIDKALASGLTFRPLGDTLRDTLAWQASADAQRPPPERISADPKPQVGLLPEREAGLIAAWRGRG